MQRVITIARHEFLTNIRRPGYIFFTLSIPAMGLLTLVITSFFSGQASQFLSSQLEPRVRPAGVVDSSQLFVPLPPGIADRFIEYPDQATAVAALVANQIDAVITIPADYVATGRITSYTRDGFSNVAAIDSAALRQFLVQGLLTGKVDPQLVARASDPVDMSVVALDSHGKPTADGPYSFVAGFIVPYLFSLLLVVSIFVSSGYLLRSVSEEKENRVIEIILSSVSPVELLAGKVIGLGALGLVQVVVWLASAYALSGGMGLGAAGAVIVLNPASLLLASVYFVLGYLVYGIIMATAGALGTNLRESQQLAGIFSFTAAIPYMIGGFMFANPNAAVARVLSFFPLTAPTMMMLRLPLGTVPVEDIVISIGVLLLTIPLVLWVGAKVFHMGLLMYGKRPTVAEMWRVLRVA